MSKGNEPAFPVSPEAAAAYAYSGNTFGLTKREYFAGQALAGIIAMTVGDTRAFGALRRQSIETGKSPAALVAQFANEVADAMMGDQP